MNYLCSALGILIIILGFIVLTQKKIMIKNEYANILATFIGLVVYSRFFVIDPQIRIYLLVIFIMIAFLLTREKGNYILYNINKKMLHTTLTKILKEKNINYTENENSIILKDYDHKSISYKQRRVDSIIINLKDIAKLPLYEEIKQEIKAKIQNIDTVVFPIAGIYLVVLGTAIIIFM